VEGAVTMRVAAAKKRGDIVADLGNSRWLSRHGLALAVVPKKHILNGACQA